MSYNGWDNWATWNAALWCDNDEMIYKDRIKRKPGDPAECQEFFEEWYPTGTPDMDAGDLANIDWFEIAEHWRADYDEIAAEG